MKKTIEKLLDKKELNRMSENDSDQNIFMNPDEKMPSEEELHAKNLLKKYNIKEKVDESSISAPTSKRKLVEDFTDLDDNLGEVKFSDKKVIDSFFEEKIGLGYNAIADDMARLENYNNLSKQYELTVEQKQAAGDIYGRIIAAENRAENIKEGYQQITEKIKDVADATRRIMNEIGGEYINKVNDYKTSPF